MMETEPTKILTNSEDLTLKIFGNDLILERVLRFAIVDGTRIVNTMASTCKLVNRKWLDSVTTVVFKLRQRDHIDLVLGSKESTFEEINARIVRFTDTYKTVTDKRRIPSFQLSIAPRNTITVEIPKNTMDCISKCGHGLVCLVLDLQEILFDEMERPIMLTPVQSIVEIPYLKKIEIRLRSVIIDRYSLGGGAFHISPTLFLQSILTCCQRLQNFRFVGDTGAIEAIPFKFDTIILPHTIKEVVLKRGVQIGLLEKLLIRTPPINLTKLTIKIPSDEITENVSSNIFRIFQHFGKQLKVLCVLGLARKDPNYEKTKIYFPVLNKLETLSIKEGNFEFQRESSSRLAIFPALKNFSLCHQTYKILRSWTEACTFNKVDRLNVDLHESRETPEYRSDLLLQQMLRLHSTFTNMTKLKICHLFSPDMCVWRFSFVNIERLQVLEFSVKRCPEDVNPHLFNAVLLGIPLTQFLDLERQKNSATGLEGRVESSFAVTNLKDLTNLTLCCCKDFECHQTVILSDAVFEFGFFKMTNLTNLIFSGRLRVSRKSELNWRTQRRKIRNGTGTN